MTDRMLVISRHFPRRNQTYHTKNERRASKKATVIDDTIVNEDNIM